MLIIAFLAIGVGLRLLFLGVQGLPRFDPWRHLLLVENLRAGRGFTLFAGLFMAASGPLVTFTCHYGRHVVTSRWASDYGIHYLVLESK